MQITTFIIVGYLILTLVSGLTYSVDETCSRFGVDGKAGLQLFDAIDEAIKMAKGAVTRLSSDTDTNFAAVYARIFTAQKADDEYFNKVKNIMTCISGLTELDASLDAKLANIRFVCDNDATTDVRVPISDTKSKKGRWRPRTDGIPGFADRSNLVLTGSDGLGCAIPNVLGVTYGIPSTTDTDLPIGRSRISICDQAFTQAVLFKNIAAGKNLELENLKSGKKEGADVLTSSLTHTVLHELSHIPSCNTVDYLIDKTTKAYGWKKATNLSPQNAIRNADNYAFIGMFSELADRGYTLPVKDVDGPDWDVLAQRGLLIHKDQMTSKRWVAGSLALGVVSSACTLNSTIDEHCLDFNA